MELRQRSQQMRRTITLVTVAALIALVPALTAATDSRRMEIADLHRIVKVSDPQISPDGKSVVCVVARANIKDNEWESELVLVATGPGGASSRPLTYGRKHVSDPRWSPSGDRIAFIGEARSEEHTSELQSRPHLVCRLLLEKKTTSHHLSHLVSNKKIKILLI